MSAAMTMVRQIRRVKFEGRECELPEKLRKLTEIPENTLQILFDFLFCNRGRTFTKLELARSFHVATRQIEHWIQALRTFYGAPIYSDGDGYRLAESREEAEAIAAVLHDRARTQLTTVSGVKQGLDVYFPPRPAKPVQERLF